MLLEYFIDDGLAQNNNHLAPKSNFNFFYFIGKEIKKKKVFICESDKITKKSNRL